MADRIPDAMLETMAVKFRLIGEPTRLAILHTLMDGGEKNVGQVVSETGRSEVNVFSPPEATGEGEDGRPAEGGASGLLPAHRSCDRAGLPTRLRLAPE